MEGNTVVGAPLGAASVTKSQYVTLARNNFSAAGLSLGGDSVDEFATHTIDSSNTAGGMPIRYIANRTGQAIDVNGSGQLIVANCTGVTIRGLSLTGFGTAALLAYVRDSAVVGGNLSGNHDTGLSVTHAENLSISGLRLASNGYEQAYQGYSYPEGWGLYVSYSSHITMTGLAVDANLGGGLSGFEVRNSTIEDSTFSSHREVGIGLAQASDLIIRNNSFEANGIGLRILYGSHSDTIRDNVFRGNRVGAYLNGANAIAVANNTFAATNGTAVWGLNDNDPRVLDNRIGGGVEGVNFSFVRGGRIEGNTISSNANGVVLINAQGVLVFHNLLINNALQAVDNSDQNRWNGTPAEGGNYWSNYTGPDLCSGPNQDDCSAPDGFGDVPVAVPAGGEGRFYTHFPVQNVSDYYPLMTTTIPTPVAPGEPAPWQPPPTAAELLQLALLGLLALLSATAVWIYLSRLRETVPPPPPAA